MSSEETNRLALDNFLCDSMSDSDPFIRTRTPSQLIDDDETRFRLIASFESTEDHTHRDHFLSKGGKRRFEIVVVAESGEES